MTDNLPPIEITDHAVVRYMERGLGVDMDALREEIMPERTRRQAAGLGTARIPIIRGLVAIVRNGKITTLEPQLKRRVDNQRGNG